MMKAESTLNRPKNQQLRFSNKQKSDFFPTLRQRVEDYFKDNQYKKQADYRMFVKTIVMLSLYAVPYFLILSGWFSPWQMLGLTLLMGVGMAGVGMSIMHDALHGTYSSKGWVNRLLGSSLYLLGGNVFCWKTQHNVLHHTFTNVFEVDEDIDTKWILRLSPEAPLKKYHRFQYIYAFPLYSLMTFSFLVKDFIKVFQYHQKDFKVKVKSDFYKDLSVLILTKVLYITFALVLPYYVLGIAWWQVLLGFLVVHMTAGLILSVIFQLAHVVEGTTYPVPDETGSLENTWAVHQLYTTSNFARNNQLLSWYIGGLNFQVEHHLFPHVCHIHYKPISEIVRQTAAEFELPYYEQKTFGQAINSHIRMLKQLGRA
ncbi:fatty acid desaturase family protein [Eisenibacter elegans]|uniref:fatty acid desaturase family protein n=1 Tax=Eisenibacter elegans TaxID=997 RepID=UPI00047D9113|nr:acyl-CoA desaturase [Eisenibacter elegans]